MIAVALAIALAPADDPPPLVIIDATGCHLAAPAKLVRPEAPSSPTSAASGSSTHVTFTLVEVPHAR